MRTLREFDASMSAQEAAGRARYLLGNYRYHSWGIPGGIRFERGFPLSGAMVVRPQRVHCILDMRIVELGENACRIVLDRRIFKLGSPSSKADKTVWRGELDDVEALLTRRENPKIDRIRQDVYAGRLTLFYIFVCLMVIIGTGLIALSFMDAHVAIWLGLAAFLGLALLLPFLPFDAPDYPLSNPMPEAPIESNYPRTPR